MAQDKDARDKDKVSTPVAFQFTAEVNKRNPVQAIGSF